jgi:hypothetical protein
MSQTLDDLKERVKAINDIFTKLLDDWTNLELHVQTQLTTGINKAYGQAASFEHEYETVVAAEKKGRPVITQIHADVTTGEADSLFAKSIEAKSLTAPTKGAANALITKAIKQVAGKTGSLPRANDVRVIDLRIEGTNPWPASGGAYGQSRPTVSLENIQQWAKDELWAITGGASPVPGASELIDWLNGETHSSDIFKRPKIVVAAFQKKFEDTNAYSSRLLVTGSENKLSQLRCLTIKIRYQNPYVTYKQQNTQKSIHLEELIFQIYKGATTKLVKIELAKIKYRVPDKHDDIKRKFFLDPT